MDILSLLLEHRLPTMTPTSVLAGPGEGLPCEVCRQSISAAQIQYEFEAAEPPWLSGTLRMHLPCFRGWQAALSAPVIHEPHREPNKVSVRDATHRFLLAELDVARELLAIARATLLPPMAIRSRQRAQEIYLRVLTLTGRFSLHVETHRTLFDALGELRRLLDEPSDRVQGALAPRLASYRQQDEPPEMIRFIA